MSLRVFWGWLVAITIPLGLACWFAFVQHDYGRFEVPLLVALTIWLAGWWPLTRIDRKQYAKEQQEYRKERVVK